MSREAQKFIIAGAGGIGKAVGLILTDRPGIAVEIFIGDIDKNLAEEVAKWISDGCSSVCSVEAFEIHPSQITNEMDYVFKSGDIILDCLPGTEAPRMAKVAIDYNMHYVNLTEYVKETDEIIELAKNAKTGFVLQSGLAPGYINVVAHKLYKDFVKKFKIEKVDNIKMRVGALTSNVAPPSYYAFTWSPIGVATEYVKDANIIKDGKLCKVPALTETEDRIIQGIRYEEDFTSGGAADLPEFFQGKTQNLDYKTIRYPGHYNWIRTQIAENKNEIDPVHALLHQMLKKVPHIDDDLIVMYASVSGVDANGELKQLEHSQVVHPKTIGAHKLKAIQITTAAPMLESARMLLQGNYQGVVLQSQIDPEKFMHGPFIQMVYNPKNHENHHFHEN
ncbi:MAG: saccharopine dehydrogenase [Saprospiraceae bacterium]|nr:saccharopine dehydrogenase [Saprospiraceae bacterium]